MTHIQSVFPENTNGRQHGVLTQVQADDLGCPTGNLVRNDGGGDTGIHAEGQNCAARGDDLQSFFKAVAGCFDDDVSFAAVGELVNLFFQVDFVWVPGSQPALVRQVKPEGVNLGNGDFGGNVFGKLGKR